MKRSTALVMLTYGSSAALFARPPAVLAQAAPSAPYKIGVTFPLTGIFALNTGDYIPAIEVAIAEINARGGLHGHPVQSAFEDSQGSPQGGLAAMRKLVQVDGVQALLTGYTNVVTAQLPLADELKVPLVSPLESPGVMSKSQYGFSTAPTVDAGMPLLREYWKRTRVKRVFGFLINNAFGEINSPLVKAAVESAGAQYAEARFNGTDTDFRGLVARSKDFAPDAVIVMSAGSVIADSTLFRQIRELGIMSQLMCYGNNYNEHAWREAVGPITEGMIFAGLNFADGAGRDFIAAYRAKTSHDPGLQSAEVYDIIKIIAYAIDKSSYSGDAIRNVIASLKGFPSVVGGPITMRDNHYAQVPIHLWLAKSGKLEQVPGL